MTAAYHQIQQGQLDNALTHGLTTGQTGDKREGIIYKTDEFLNQLRPKPLLSAGVDRIANIFCYLAHGEEVIDIVSGRNMQPQNIAQRDQQPLVRVDVDPTRCYIGNLDLYDEIKDLLQSSKTAQAGKIARVYWGSVQLLAEYKQNIRRPELMVTYDMPPTSLSTVYQP